MKDITFEDDDRYICPTCSIPLTFHAWNTKKKFGIFGEIIWLMFTPKSWIKS